MSEPIPGRGPDQATVAVLLKKNHPRGQKCDSGGFVGLGSVEPYKGSHALRNTTNMGFKTLGTTAGPTHSGEGFKTLTPSNRPPDKAHGLVSQLQRAQPLNAERETSDESRQASRPAQDVPQIRRYIVAASVGGGNRADNDDDGALGDTGQRDQMLDLSGFGGGITPPDIKADGGSDFGPPYKNTIEREEGDPHDKPIKLFLSEQSVSGKDFDSSNRIVSLMAWEESVDAVFATHPAGKIAVVYECEDGTSETSEKITREVLEGVRPSLAIQHAWGYISSGRYNYDRAMVLDRIAAKYPGRLYLVQEWQREGMVENWPDWSTEYFRDDADKLPITDEELTEEREKVNARAALRQEIHAQMKNIIADALAQEDVVGAVGLVGLPRSGVSHALTAEEYTVDMVFLEGRSEETQETFTFSPMLALDRLAELGREITNEDVLLAIRGEQRALVELKQNGWTNIQDVLRRTHAWMEEQRQRGVEQLKLGDPVYQLEQEYKREALEEQKSLAALDEQASESGEQESSHAIEVTDEQWYGARDELIRFAETDPEEIGNVNSAEDLERFLGNTFFNINTLVISHPNTQSVGIYDNLAGRMVRIGTRESFDVLLNSKSSNPTRVKIDSENGKLEIHVDIYAKSVKKGFHKDQSIVNMEPLPIGESVAATLQDTGPLELQLIASQMLGFVRNYLWIFGTTHENFW